MIESKRLILRKIMRDDFELLAKMLKDIDVMYAWEHAFSDEEINNWIINQLKRYHEDGIGYLLAIDKNTNETVGQIGLLRQLINGEKCWGIGYILCKEHWGKGYATEGAKACLGYAFNVLDADKVICDIRPQNIASINVAKRLGMTKTGEHIKHYNGQDMLHEIYEITKTEYQRIH
ncbi:MAG: GNAT family N-acetyltransferase [Clostridiaceae bacterium]|nr:GNAT family N-acetyltransferase [Clostridiaceae bacterium]